VDAAGYPTQSTRVPIGFRLAGQPMLAWIVRRVLPRSTVRSSVESSYGDPSLVTDSLVDRYYELTLRAGNRTSLLRRFAQPRVDADTLQLQGLTVPTLILWGAKDGLIPPENAARFARDVPNNRVIMYPEVGHVPQEEEPARTVADVKAFLVSVNRTGVATPEGPP
jgi:pimeloyl-ACP methyl ester carboxylesterase